MTWLKKGRIFIHPASKNYKTHAHKPTAVLIGDKLRIYYGIRNYKNQTLTTFIDVDPQNPKRIIYKHLKPVMSLGELGSYDDAGINVSSIVKLKNKLYMYYIAWNPSTTVPTRNSLGLAISQDNGISFTKIFNAPVLDRSKFDPFFIGAGYVLKRSDKWRSWYTSGKKWKIINGKPEIWYSIKYAQSSDGINWDVSDNECIVPLYEYECTARPSVLYERKLYKMWYTYRDMRGFRHHKTKSYRIGYAESVDGINWQRKDNDNIVNIGKTGWDSQMIAYPNVIKVGSKKYMFYNGNNFGETGMGYAEFID